MVVEPPAVRSDARLGCDPERQTWPSSSASPACWVPTKAPPSTVMGKGVKFPTGTAVLDAFRCVDPARAFPDQHDAAVVGGLRQFVGQSVSDELLLQSVEHRRPSASATARRAAGASSSTRTRTNLQIANNRVHNNTGTMSGGITVSGGASTRKSRWAGRGGADHVPGLVRDQQQSRT